MHHCIRTQYSVLRTVHTNRLPVYCRFAGLELPERDWAGEGEVGEESLALALALDTPSCQVNARGPSSHSEWISCPGFFPIEHLR